MGAERQSLLEQTATGRLKNRKHHLEKIDGKTKITPSKTY